MLHEGGGDCVKYLKRRWNRKEGRGNKEFKKGGNKLGQGAGALKRGGWNPLTNNVFIFMPKTHVIIHFFLEILHFKESCNLIGWQYFGPYLET